MNAYAEYISYEQAHFSEHGIDKVGFWVNY